MKLKLIANSLVTRLVLMSLVLLVLGTAGSYWQLTRFLRHDLMAMVAARQTTLADHVARDVDASLALRLQLLQRTAQSLPPALLNRPAELQTWLADRHRQQPLFLLGLLVTDAQGRVIAQDQPRPALAGASFAAEAAQAAVAFGRGDRAWVGSPRPSVQAGLPMLPLASPLRTASGALAGLLLGVEEITAQGFLAALLDQHGVHAGGLLIISPRDRVVVASTQPEMLPRPSPAQGLNALHDRAMAGFRGSGTTVNANGVEEISAIASVPLSGWFVVAQMPAAEALVPVTRLQNFILQRRLPVVALVLVFIACIFAWLLRPLLLSARLADRMTRGELEPAPLPVVRNDEVGHLTASFNRLLAKLAEKQAELERLAHHDSLTGLPNRKLLIDRLQQALARAQRQRTQLALLFMDLDGFKRLNDGHGHEVGDAALKAIAHQLAGVVRQGDTVARLGGDEFVLLAPDLAGDTEAAVQALVQKCRDAVQLPLLLGGAQQVLGVSIGAAVSGGQHSPSELLLAADQDMYAAKLRGRGAGLVPPKAAAELQA